MRRKGKRTVTVIFTVIIAVLLSITALMSYIVKNHDREIADMTFENIDLSKVADGTYIGGCRVLPVVAEVEVTVKDHKITDIGLTRHINGQGASAEVIPGRVIEAQGLNVEVVSGATSSSKVILKAIENALSNAS